MKTGMKTRPIARESSIHVDKNQSIERRSRLLHHRKIAGLEYVTTSSHEIDFVKASSYLTPRNDYIDGEIT